MPVDHTIHSNFDFCRNGNITPREVAVPSVLDSKVYMLFRIRNDPGTFYFASDIASNLHSSKHGHLMPFPPDNDDDEDKDKEENQQQWPTIAAVRQFFEQSFPDTTVFGCRNQCRVLQNLFGITSIVDVMMEESDNNETAPTLHAGHRIDDRTVRCSLRLAWNMARTIENKQQKSQRRRRFYRLEDNVVTCFF